MKLMPADLLTHTLYGGSWIRKEVGVQVTHIPSGITKRAYQTNGEFNLYMAQRRAIEALQTELDEIEMPRIFRDPVFKIWVMSPRPLIEDDKDERVSQFEQELWNAAFNWVVVTNQMERENDVQTV